MTVSLKTHKMLWGRAAGCCSKCERALVVDGEDTDDQSLVGEACHIVAEKPDGPRGKSDLTQEQRNRYGNLVLLCGTCHKVVDDQFHIYTVEVLHELKNGHEQKMDAQHHFDKAKQHDDEIDAGLIDEWASRMDLDNWRNWTSWLLGGDAPAISVTRLESLQALGPWLLGRIWTHRNPGLESALTNFRIVANDFCNVFGEYSEKHGDDWWKTEKFYKARDWNQAKYHRLLKIYQFHVYLLEDLTFELTRSANYVCDHVRQSIDHSYRRREGALLVEGGPYDDDMRFNTFRPEYRGDQRTEFPYPGLEKFKNEVRFIRDYHFGRKDDEQG